MTVSAHDIAAELRDRLPGLPVKKLHKLLYYCQGHHLAAFDRPLFPERIDAWDMGPVVSALWRDERRSQAAPPRRQLGEAELNTIGYVISRYGNLTGTDLEHLTHSETPWQLADSSRRPGESVTIRQDWIKEFFRTTGAPRQQDDEAVLDTADVRAWLAEAAVDERGTHEDSVEALRARLVTGV
ncbi:Panacea domain-containing protein [Micromonospora sp. WMMD1082]|uniref:Panacea domain-containing protein n=1 Tax=Micromonospora sp. WMMD1082 TaxID=3016104 RepID=UPI0024178BBD|nr:Panacea domain-containing protein [Micromonospora sp. WMMD1082]MDG4794392.1 Panacea domain-containing protein [Micromonospora sp. WMMD1082]